MTNIDTLGKVAADLAMRGAVEYLRLHDPDRRVNVDALVAELRQRAPAALHAALADAREALDARMDAMATATFAASMHLVGIQAAKAVMP